MISPEYAAGFFDGEGNVTILPHSNNNSFLFCAQIANTNKNIIDLLQKQFGGSVGVRKRRHKKWKDCYVLYLAAKKAAIFLYTIRDFVIVKKPQVELALQFWEFTRQPKTERCELISIVRTNGVPAKHFRLKPEIIRRENEFRGRLSILNRRGVDGTGTV